MIEVWTYGEARRDWAEDHEHGADENFWGDMGSSVRRVFTTETAAVAAAEARARELYEDELPEYREGPPPVPNWIRQEDGDLLWEPDPECSVDTTFLVWRIEVVSGSPAHEEPAK